MARCNEATTVTSYCSAERMIRKYSAIASSSSTTMIRAGFGAGAEDGGGGVGAALAAASGGAATRVALGAAADARLRWFSASLSAIGSEIDTVVPVPTRESTSR